MKIDHSWLSISEAARRFKITTEQILHLGITGKLKLSFDWVVCKIESDTLNLSNISIFEFVTIDDIYYCPERKANFESLIPIPEPEHKNAPLLRLATLTEDQLALINKNGEVSITRAILSIHDCIDMNLPQSVETMIYPKVSTKDIVVKLSDIIEYENIAIGKVPVKTSKPESSKELDNQVKLIGLLCKAVLFTGPKNLNKDGEPIVKNIAIHLSTFIPVDMDDTGIGYESIRKKISAGLSKLDPKNY
jgi:hypothetical protein